MSYQSPHRILIVGGGFAGVGVALSLVRLRHRSRVPYAVTLVSREPYHVYQPALYEIATAVGDCCRGTLLRSLGTFSYDEVFHSRGVFVRQDNVERIDRQRRVCRMKSGERILYDTVVIATGATANYFGVLGAQEHTFVLRTFDDALRLRHHIQTLCARQGRGVSQDDRTIVIVGAGASGVEVTAELQGMLRCITPRRVSLSYRILLIEAARQILPGQSPSVQSAALRRLRSLGVSIMTGTALTSVTAAGVTLSNGASIATRTVVWATGVVAQPPAIEPDVRYDSKGRVVVDATLCVPGQLSIMALGDCAAIEQDGTMLAIPQTASMAIREARWAARALVERLNGRTLQPFQPRFPGYILPLGGRYALWSNASGRIVLEGFWAWVARRCIDFGYARSVTSLTRALRQSLRSTTEFMKND